jgi:hypothetical protein
MCRNFRSIEWHQKTYHKSLETIPLSYLKIYHSWKGHSFISVLRPYCTFYSMTTCVSSQYIDKVSSVALFTSDYVYTPVLLLSKSCSPLSCLTLPKACCISDENCLVDLRYRTGSSWNNFPVSWCKHFLWKVSLFVWMRIRIEFKCWIRIQINLDSQHWFLLLWSVDSTELRIQQISSTSVWT